MQKNIAQIRLDKYVLFSRIAKANISKLNKTKMQKNL